MVKTSKELLDSVGRPSLLDGLLLGREDSSSNALQSKAHVNLKERPPFVPLPKSQALGKVKEFLEVITKAKKDLGLRSQEKPSSIDNIEVLKDDEKEYIEMDLLLGVTDLYSDEAVAAAEASMSGLPPKAAASVKCTKHSVGVDELSKRNKRPKIVMLN